jgi:prepilin-type N-terminal cleavage/methylation domain-containing protein
MQQINFKKGFTLVELLLAIFLVSLMAYFVFSTPRGATMPKIEINATNLPFYLQENLKGDGELICVGKSCKECYFLTNNSVAKASFPLNIKVLNQYIIDRNENPIKIKRGRFNDKPICLRIYHYKNGSISPTILETTKNYLFIGSYFKEGKEFSSLNDAIEYWLNDSDKLRSKGEWY